MGKPYKTELLCLRETYNWCLQVPITKLQSFVNTAREMPLVAVGSGGSLTTAHMAVLLHQSIGNVSRSTTPLQLLNFGESLRDAGVLIMTAGGRNVDVLSAFRFAALCEPRELMAVCTRTQSPLAQLASEFQYTNIFDMDIPSGPDGFLATNSLLASLIVLIRAYKHLLPHHSDIKSLASSAFDILDELKAVSDPVLNKDTWIVLYGGWGEPAAIDLESKFTEAALGQVQLADYRNFAHGRHHWLAKRGTDTAVIAIVTPNERDLATRTLKLLPQHIPTMVLATEENDSVGGLDLVLKVMHLVYLVGQRRGIDPGRPGVPEFGRRIYNLRSSSRKATKLPAGLSSQEVTAILRKSKKVSLSHFSAEELQFWTGCHRDFMGELCQSQFGAVVFDYDGTLCDGSKRDEGLSLEIGEELIRLLREHIVVGIATGRGSSVRTALQNILPKEYWHDVVVGYYNGSDTALLDDNSHPDKTKPMEAELQEISRLLQSSQQLHGLVKQEDRPSQISLEPTSGTAWKRMKAIILDILRHADIPGIRLVESSHSLDIIGASVSKVAVMEVCRQIAQQQSKSERVLCIGDCGEWPGNDYDLLASPFSLSVDTVSPNSRSCWNISKEGHRGVQATLQYLKSLHAQEGILRFMSKAPSRRTKK